MQNEIIIRKQSADDIESVMKIVQRTEFFRALELDIAKEVLEDAANGSCGYQSFVAVCNDKLAGWVCFGQTPCTLGTFDIYWLAVDCSLQGKGIGSKLLSFAQIEITARQGRLIVIETSGSELYSPTQRFYLSNGYTLAATVKDFYATGDDKLIFTKQVKI